MKFKCKASGNIYDFADYDTEQMLKHPEYEVVVEDEVTEKPSKRSYTKKETASEESDLAA